VYLYICTVCVVLTVGDGAVDWHNSSCDYAVGSIEFSRARTAADVDM